MSLGFLKRWLGRTEPPGGAPDANPAGQCCLVCQSSRLRAKQLIACPGGYYLCLACAEKLAGTFGAGAGAGFSTEVHGACNFCKRSGPARPPALRTRSGALCKDCIRTIAQMVYEQRTFPPQEVARRRQLNLQRRCYFCGQDRASVRGQGYTLICWLCLESLAKLGTNRLIEQDVRCDLCMRPLRNQLGQAGVAGGFVCAHCLRKHQQALDPHPPKAS